MKEMHVELIAPEVVRKIRTDNQVLLRTTEGIHASLETGRFDDAGPIAAELCDLLRTHVLLVDGVLDVLSPDDIAPTSRSK